MELVIQNLRHLCHKRLLPITTINETLQCVDTNLFKFSVKYHSNQPSRNTIYIDNNMSIYTLGFMPNQYLPMQHYGRFNVFFVVLEGEIMEYVYIKPFLFTQHYIHKVGNGNYIHESIGYNKIHNKSSKNASILQLFVI